jgi:hypothetical protein
MTHNNSPQVVSVGRSLWRAALLFVLAAPPIAAGCGRTATLKEAPPAERRQPQAGFFEDVTEAKGLPAKSQPWPEGTFATPEVTAGGVALFDYDNDGRLDILHVCHGRPGRFDEPAPIRLFHQEPDGTFREVANAGGLSAPGYAHGVAIGDYDNDGYPDVYITTYGRNALFRNTGDGTYTDVTAAASLLTKQEYWSSSAAWVDYDRDGHLDLFVVHFAEFDPKRVCPGDDGKRDYCGPSQFKGVVPALYHNNGDGTFTDVTAKAGINYPGRGWGVVCADLTGDGWVDIFVANDEERQNLWVNQHDGTFKDEAILRGVAFNGAGRPEAGMGVAVGDLANDGRLSLFITHIRGEKNTLYAPVEKGMYVDGSATAGMAAPGLTYTGWGCGFVDVDNDGHLDLPIVNGRVSRGPVHPKAALGPYWNAYAENNLLLRGDGRGHFTDITARGGDFTAQIDNTRGLALGDIDGDGRVDLVTNTVDNTLRVFRNVTPTEGNHWLLVRAVTGKRDALGARVELVAGERRWTRLVLAAYSFCSSCDPRAHFGLGKVSHIDALEVTWPGGPRERFDAPKIDRVITLYEGKGRLLP